MKMVSMKLKPRKKEDQDKVEAYCDEQDKYPWGLRLNLCNEQLDALGMKDLPKVGSNLTITCAVDVVEARASERQGGEEQRSVELQVTAIGLDEGKKVDTDKVESNLYGKKES